MINKIQIYFIERKYPILKDLTVLFIRKEQLWAKLRRIYKEGENTIHVSGELNVAYHNYNEMMKKVKAQVDEKSWKKYEKMLDKIHKDMV